VRTAQRIFPNPSARHPPIGTIGAQLVATGLGTIVRTAWPRSCLSAGGGADAEGGTQGEVNESGPWRNRSVRHDGHDRVQRSRLRDPGSVGSEDESQAFILANQVAEAVTGAAIRHSDVAGDDALADPRLSQQLAVIKGRRLSQFSIAINGIRLQFWGSHASPVAREVFIEHPTVELTRTGESGITHDSRSEAVAVSLLSVLNRPATDVAIVEGELTVTFDNLTLSVDPDEQYESWQINSDDGLLIVCMPGGELTIWYPPDAADDR